MFKALRGLFTGRYESKPIMLMGEDDVKDWVAEHSACSSCSHPIDPERDDYTLINDSAAGISAHHQSCPDAAAVRTLCEGETSREP